MTEEKGQSFTEELSRIAQQVNENLKRFQESDSTKKFLQDLQDQVDEAQKKLEDLMQSDEVERMKESLKRLNDDLASGNVQKDLKKSTLQGLKELDEGIQKLIQSMEKEQDKDE